MAEGAGGRRLERDLVTALERARSRLAVAVAAEFKATSVEYRRRYRDMDDRLRRCVRELRSMRGAYGGPGLLSFEALDALEPLLAAGVVAGGAGESQRLTRELAKALTHREAALAPAREAAAPRPLAPAAGDPRRE